MFDSKKLKGKFNDFERSIKDCIGPLKGVGIGLIPLSARCYEIKDEKEECKKIGKKYSLKDALKKFNRYDALQSAGLVGSYVSGFLPEEFGVRMLAQFGSMASYMFGSLDNWHRVQENRKEYAVLTDILSSSSKMN